MPCLNTRIVVFVTQPMILYRTFQHTYDFLLYSIRPLGGPESELKKRYPQRPNAKCVIAMVLKFKNLRIGSNALVQAVSGPPRGIRMFIINILCH